MAVRECTYCGCAEFLSRFQFDKTQSIIAAMNQHRITQQAITSSLGMDDETDSKTLAANEEWFWSVLNIGLVSHFEAMINIYLEAIASNRVVLCEYQEDMSSENINNNENDHVEKNISNHADWQKRIMRLISDSARESDNNGILSSDKCKVLQRALFEFQKYDIIVQAIVRRNLFLHAGGVMNARNYSVCPMAKVGETVSSNYQLISELWGVLRVLNRHIATAVEGNSYTFTYR